MSHEDLAASGPGVPVNDAGATAPLDRDPLMSAPGPDFPYLCESCHQRDAAVWVMGYAVCGSCVVDMPGARIDIPRELMAE